MIKKRIADQGIDSVIQLRLYILVLQQKQSFAEIASVLEDDQGF